MCGPLNFQTSINTYTLAVFVFGKLDRSDVAFGLRTLRWASSDSVPCSQILNMWSVPKISQIWISKMTAFLAWREHSRGSLKLKYWPCLASPPTTEKTQSAVMIYRNTARTEVSEGNRWRKCSSWACVCSCSKGTWKLNRDTKVVDMSRTEPSCSLKRKSEFMHSSNKEPF